MNSSYQGSEGTARRGAQTQTDSGSDVNWFLATRRKYVVDERAGIQKCPNPFEDGRFLHVGEPLSSEKKMEEKKIANCPLLGQSLWRPRLGGEDDFVQQVSQIY